MRLENLRVCAYRQPSDLARAQAALMAWTREARPSDYLHKGDIGHRLFNNCYGYDVADLFRYWLDEADQVQAFASLYPHWQSFDLQVAPWYAHSDAHAAMIKYCERESLQLAEKYGKTINKWIFEASDCDLARDDFLAACGYWKCKHWFTLTRHTLAHIPDAALPAGFHFHDATDADVAKLADVHNHSFTSKWNADSYGAVFRAPHMEYEIVAVAPDGRFAAFTNVWVDDVNRSLLFEPVGTHSDFRRRGIGKALMAHVLRRMRAERGIERAYVCHEPADKNPASGALYASLGFQALHKIYEYAKPVT